MSEVEYIEFLELRVSIRALREKLTHSELAALTVSSYCANEVNNFSKLAALTDYGITGDQVVDWHNKTMQSGLLRSLTIRLVDFWRFLNKCERQNGDVGAVAKSVKADFPWVEEMLGHEVAISIRDKSAAHASFEDAKAVLKQVDDWIDASFTLHKEAANSIYSLGEEAFTYGLLKGLVDDNHNYDDLVECWHDWIKHIQSALTCFHIRLMDKLVSDRFDPTPKKKHFVNYPSDRLADAQTGIRLPTFVSGVYP